MFEEYKAYVEGIFASSFIRCIWMVLFTVCYLLAWISFGHTDWCHAHMLKSCTCVEILRCHAECPCSLWLEPKYWFCLFVHIIIWGGGLLVAIPVAAVSISFVYLCLGEGNLAVNEGVPMNLVDIWKGWWDWFTGLWTSIGHPILSAIIGAYITGLWSMWTWIFASGAVFCLLLLLGMKKDYGLTDAFIAVSLYVVVSNHLHHWLTKCFIIASIGALRHTVLPLVRLLENWYAAKRANARDRDASRELDSIVASPSLDSPQGSE